jgi:hypothetical protein
VVLARLLTQRSTTALQNVFTGFDWHNELPRYLGDPVVWVWSYRYLPKVNSSNASSSSNAANDELPQF